MRERVKRPLVATTTWRAGEGSRFEIVSAWEKQNRFSPIDLSIYQRSAQCATSCSTPTIPPSQALLLSRQLHPRPHTALRLLLSLFIQQPPDDPRTTDGRTDGRADGGAGGRSGISLRSTDEEHFCRICLSHLSLARSFGGRRGGGGAPVSANQVLR